MKKTEVNVVLTYSYMAGVLDLDPVRDREEIRQAFYRAAKKHEREDKRAVEVVKGVGYRVVEAKEHLALARKHQKRSGRQLSKAVGKVTNVDLNGMDPAVRQGFEMVRGIFLLQEDFNRRTARKLQNHDEAIQSLIQAKDRTEAEREELKSRIERLERGWTQAP